MSVDSGLAPYAMHDADSAGRRHSEPTHAYRSPYQRDRDRIVHSSAFRRLAHKTQVFTGDMGDYHRSRLTHTLEVASIARTVGRALRLNEDLIEALALVHDIGHPPFGHAGEDVLDERLRREGGFNHNQQALRIVERLEVRYPEFPGLNLSHEVLSGQRSRAVKEPAATPLLEVQVVDAADSIAYDAHDADDAVELGLIELRELDESPLWRTATAGARRRYAGLAGKMLRRAVVHELIDLLVSDLLRSTQSALAAAAPGSAAEACRLGRPLVQLSPEVARQKRRLESLLFEQVYRHPVVVAERDYAAGALGELFDRCARQPQTVPEEFSTILAEEGAPRAAADYVSSLTDRTALEEHSRLAAPASRR